MYRYWFDSCVKRVYVHAHAYIILRIGLVFLMWDYGVREREHSSLCIRIRFSLVFEAAILFSVNSGKHSIHSQHFALVMYLTKVGLFILYLHILETMPIEYISLISEIRKYHRKFFFPTQRFFQLEFFWILNQKIINILFETLIFLCLK